MLCRVRSWRSQLQHFQRNHRRCWTRREPSGNSRRRSSPRTQLVGNFGLAGLVAARSVECLLLKKSRRCLRRVTLSTRTARPPKNFVSEAGSCLASGGTHPDLWLVHRGIRHRRTKGSKGVARRVGLKDLDPLRSHSANERRVCFWLKAVMSGLEFDVCLCPSFRHAGGDVRFRPSYVRSTSSFRHGR